MGSILTLPLDWWDRVMKVNVMGALVCSRAVVPSMRERGGGRIINQVSGGAFIPGGVYSISKLALVSLTTTLATELGPPGHQRQRHRARVRRRRSRLRVAGQGRPDARRDPRAGCRARRRARPTTSWARSCSSRRQRGRLDQRPDDQRRRRLDHEGLTSGRRDPAAPADLLGARRPPRVREPRPTALLADEHGRGLTARGLPRRSRTDRRRAARSRASARHRRELAAPDRASTRSCCSPRSPGSARCRTRSSRSCASARSATSPTRRAPSSSSSDRSGGGSTTGAGRARSRPRSGAACSRATRSPTGDPSALPDPPPRTRACRAGCTTRRGRRPTRRARGTPTRR